METEILLLALDTGSVVSAIKGLERNNPPGFPER